MYFHKTESPWNRPEQGYLSNLPNFKSPLLISASCRICQKSNHCLQKSFTSYCWIYGDIYVPKSIVDMSFKIENNV